MKKLILILSLVFINLSQSKLYAQEWWELWPSELTEETPYYRGQSTKLASFNQLVRMLLNSDSDEIISSRFTRSLKKVRPLLTNRELVELSDLQRKYWKENGLEWRIKICHADPFMCSLPSVQTLMANIFDVSELPEFIKEVYINETTNSDYRLSSYKNGSVLEFFDPIVSTSYLLDVAKRFARDKNGFDGYVLILNDKNNRNCTIERKKKAKCFIETEEYIEEFELPMWGYATAQELDGVIVGALKLVRKMDQILEITLENEINRAYMLDLRENEKACEYLKEIKTLSLSLEKEARLIQAIEQNYSCR